MDVKVQTKCGRCGRTGEKVVSIDQASELLATEKQQTAALEKFIEALNEQDGDFLPEVIILKKNADRGFDVETLDNLCELDGKRSKGCKSRVNYLIEDLMFRIKHESKPAEPLAEGEETPKRKRRTRAEMEAARAEAASAEA